MNIGLKVILATSGPVALLGAAWAIDQAGNAVPAHDTAAPPTPPATTQPTTAPASQPAATPSLPVPHGGRGARG